MQRSLVTVLLLLLLTTLSGKAAALEIELPGLAPRYSFMVLSGQSKQAATAAQHGELFLTPVGDISAATEFKARFEAKLGAPGSVHGTVAYRGTLVLDRSTGELALDLTARGPASISRRIRGKGCLGAVGMMMGGTCTLEGRGGVGPARETGAFFGALDDLWGNLSPTIVPVPGGSPSFPAFLYAGDFFTPDYPGIAGDNVFFLKGKGRRVTGTARTSVTDVGFYEWRVKGEWTNNGILIMEGQQDQLSIRIRAVHIPYTAWLIGTLRATGERQGQPVDFRAVVWCATRDPLSP